MARWDGWGVSVRYSRRREGALEQRGCVSGIGCSGGGDRGDRVDRGGWEVRW